MPLSPLMMTFQRGYPNPPRFRARSHLADMFFRSEDWGPPRVAQWRLGSFSKALPHTLRGLVTRVTSMGIAGAWPWTWYLAPVSAPLRLLLHTAQALLPLLPPHLRAYGSFTFCSGGVGNLGPLPHGLSGEKLRVGKGSSKAHRDQ